jgi:polysaccharide pyruvyl transferase WcaK-like protein
MRYHSVVFAETLKVNYMALDYTNGGKIRGFLKDNNKLDRIIAPEDLVKI